LASRVARFSRRAGLRYFASLEAACAIVGNPAERLEVIEEGGHVLRAPAIYLAIYSACGISTARPSWERTATGMKV
jgi:hypothetical protein